MPATRTYGDTCGIARALDLVGERWALLVVRELVHGPKRFTDLRAGLPTIGPDVLTQRLRELEEAGVVSRRTLPAPAASRVYDLTHRGRELEPVLLSLGQWGSRTPVPRGGPPLSVDATVLALQTLFDAEGAEGVEATVELRLGDAAFGLHVDAGRLEVVPGGVDDPTAVVTTDPRTLAAVLWHARGQRAAERSGALKLEGSRGAVKRLFALFPAPAAR